MMSLSDLLGMLALRIRFLRLQAERRTLIYGVVCFSAGFLAYILLRNHVYSALPEITDQPAGLFHYLIRLNLIQTLVFLLSVYIPALILLGNSISGEGPGAIGLRAGIQDAPVRTFASLGADFSHNRSRSMDYSTFFNCRNV